MAQGKFIVYLRVSTQKQGRSGLGLEAQKKAVTDYLNGGAWSVVAEFTEVESGKSDANRPQLQRAIQACRIYGAKLLIAKLDRLSRNAAFLLNLDADLKRMKLGFVAADMPDANEMTIGIMAVVAQGEREMISARTKAALAAAKARGISLGRAKGEGNVMTDEYRAKATVVLKARAESRASDLAPIISDLRAAGATSLRSLAAGLNQAGIAPPRGATWSPMAVSRTLARIEAH